ncbi:MAG: hypothetical protein ACYTGP_09650 [Planctomycetota bacterium]|jgi:hypothetical protein
MRFRGLLIIVLAGLVITAGACESTPRTEYGGYGLDYQEPEPEITLESILEGIADIALFALSIWAGYELSSNGYHGYHGSRHAYGRSYSRGCSSGYRYSHR